MTCEELVTEIKLRIMRRMADYPVSSVIPFNTSPIRGELESLYYEIQDHEKDFIDLCKQAAKEERQLRDLDLEPPG